MEPARLEVPYGKLWEAVSYESPGHIARDFQEDSANQFVSEFKLKPKYDHSCIQWLATANEMSPLS